MKSGKLRVRKWKVHWMLKSNKEYLWLVIKKNILIVKEGSCLKP